MNSRTILLADKEKIVGLSTKKMLESIGYCIPDIYTTKDGLEEGILSFSPKVLVMETVFDDHQKKDGIQLAEEIKNKYQIPIVFLTSYDDDETIEEARKIEPVAYFSKVMQQHQLKLSFEITLKLYFKSIEDQVERNMLQHITSISPNFLINISADGVIGYANQQSFRFTGQQNEAIIGQNIFDVFSSPDSSQFLEEIIGKTKEKRRKTFTEGEIDTLMGKRHVEISAVPQVNSEKETTSISFVINDVTDQKLITIDMQDKHRKIKDSINYSRNIQQAIFSDLNNIFVDHFEGFLINQPKDVIGGDFAWWHKEDDYIFLAIADCTGHGVPGAMMSLIGYFLLNQIAQHIDFPPAQILNLLDERLKDTLNQNSSDANARDGMDIGLCKINLKENVLEYSGAHRPLYFVRNGELEEIKGSRKGIGGMEIRRKKPVEFENTKIQLKPHDTFYIFSDGMPDQMNMSNNKFSAKTIRNIVSENADEQMKTIEELLSKSFVEFKGSHKQLDDVMLAGFRIK